MCTRTPTAAGRYDRQAESQLLQIMFASWTISWRRASNREAAPEKANAISSPRSANTAPSTAPAPARAPSGSRARRRLPIRPHLAAAGGRRGGRRGKARRAGATRRRPCAPRRTCRAAPCWPRRCARALLGGDVGQDLREDLPRLREGGLAVGIVGAPHHVVHADDVAEANADGVLLISTPAPPATLWPPGDRPCQSPR
jgi:hypothetical protein